MGKHRQKIDIIADILVEAGKNIGKTHIMYHTNLNFDILNKYLLESTKRNLLVLDNAQHRFELTKRGHEFLEIYKNYSKEMRSINKRLSTIIATKKLLEEMC